MSELQEKVIAALIKQVELLQESGISTGNRELSVRIITALSELLRVLS